MTELKNLNIDKGTDVIYKRCTFRHHHLHYTENNVSEKKS